MIIYKKFLLTYAADTLLTLQPLQSGKLFWFQHMPPSPFVKIHLLESSNLELYGLCLKSY